ncbi:MAG: hypothetical protein ACRCTG_11195 [Aestuariivirga sp.]
MSGLTTSHRTILRDAVVAELTALKGSGRARVPTFGLSTQFLSADEVKYDVTYCVVVTDEALQAQTLRDRDSVMTLVLVLYVRDKDDLRARLDAAIEDVYDAMLLVQHRLAPGLWKMALDELTTDDNTTAVKDLAQAVQRWSCHHHRQTTAF